MKALLVLNILIFSNLAMGSSSYINNSRMDTAVRNVYGATSGFSRTDCQTCHTTSSGPVVNSGFGAHFKTAAGQAIPGANGSGLSVAQLQTVVQNVNLLNLDSDGDAENNRTEFTNNTDPGDPNSRSGGGATTTTTTRTTATTRPPTPIDGDITKLSGSTNPEANYLSSGCGSIRRIGDFQEPQLSLPAEALAVTFGLLSLPLGFALLLRRKGDSK